MVSDEELAEKIHEFLQTSDLKNTTNNTVIKKLQRDYGVDLSSKKPFIRDQITCFLQSQYEDELEDDGFFVEDYANDDVSYSFDDEDDEDDAGSSQQLGLPVNGDSSNNIEFSNESVNLKERPGHLQKEKIKKVCMSGKHCTLSPHLQEFLGVPYLTRAEVVKHLWSYVKEKNLQDPQDGKRIICDDTLRGLLGVDSINILEINKALTKHIWPREKPKRKYKPRKREREEESCVDQVQEKRQRRTLSGFLAPLPISETLISFLGTGETALTRADVIKRIWGYIKAKNLQDPSDKKMVICDEKLKELFHVDSFHGFFVSKLLSAHLNVKM